MPEKKKSIARPTQQPAARDIKSALNQIKVTNFWLYVQFADTLIRYVEITMKQDSIVSRLQGSALYFLLLNGGASTPTQLASTMLRSKHSVTKIIDSLEKEGLVVRESTNKDRRVTSVRLTSPGLDHLRQRFARGNERARKVMGSLDIKEQKQLSALTERMRQKMNEILEEL
jgi:DNA-binding MarR family transcriptional regulator